MQLVQYHRRKRQRIQNFPERCGFDGSEIETSSLEEFSVKQAVDVYGLRGDIIACVGDPRRHSFPVKCYLVVLRCLEHLFLRHPNVCPRSRAVLYQAYRSNTPSRI